VGVGKTFIAQALGHIACRHGYHVRFTRADEMLRQLRQSRFDNSRDAEMIALTSVDLLIIDDFALEPMSKEESKDVYQLFLERTGHASMIVSSNRDTSEWLAMFDDVLLAQSAVDRFKNAAYDFVIEGESYCPDSSRSSTRRIHHRRHPRRSRLPALRACAGMTSIVALGRPPRSVSGRRSPLACRGEPAAGALPSWVAPCSCVKPPAPVRSDPKKNDRRRGRCEAISEPVVQPSPLAP
jgi:hypothetical protein